MIHIYKFFDLSKILFFRDDGCHGNLGKPVFLVTMATIVKSKQMSHSNHKANRYKQSLKE